MDERKLDDMTAAVSGGGGDLLYAIPTLRKLGVKTIYVKENFYYAPNGNLHATMKRIMESQGFECLPTSGAYPIFEFEPGLKYDYNLDNFRHQRGRGKIHIMKNIALHFGVEIDTSPWLVNIPVSEVKKPYSVIHLTERWRDGSRVDWKKVLHGITGKVYFTGWQYEWLDFCIKYGDIEWLATDDVYDLATVINGADRLYCNQSIGLVAAQGLGREYSCDFKPGKTNCMLFTDKENRL